MKRAFTLVDKNNSFILFDRKFHKLKNDIIKKNTIVAIYLRLNIPFIAMSSKKRYMNAYLFYSTDTLNAYEEQCRQWRFLVNSKAYISGE